MYFSLSIYATSGKGGNGYFDLSKKRVLRKVVYGGNGGNGGSVFIFASDKVKNFNNLLNAGNYKAENGSDGRPGKKNGKNGKNLRIYVPVGTKIFDNESNLLLSSLDKNNKFILVAKGGKKGFGNFSCRKSIKTVSKNIFLGSLPEVKFLRFELDLLSDVSIIGFPNVGKSTFINLISNSKFKVADYKFTTLYPNISMVKFHDKVFKIIDFPGVIKDASKGVGLGLEFLSDLLKTKLLLHVVDISNIFNMDSIINEVKLLSDELSSISDVCLLKEKWIIFNKSDLFTNKGFDFDFNLLYKYEYRRFFFISSKKSIGIKKLCYNIINFM